MNEYVDVFVLFVGACGSMCVFFLCLVLFVSFVVFAFVWMLLFACSSHCMLYVFKYIALLFYIL